MLGHVLTCHVITLSHPFFALIRSGSRSEGVQPSRKKQKPSSRQPDQHALPELQPWPDIVTSNIPLVADEILQRVSAQDKDKIFSLPVAESHPEIADAYASMISQPMDLQTIAEERMHAYSSITMLQDDLILMYRNCCMFNEPGTIYWDYARERWEELNDLFKDVCNSLDVLLPRRWNG